ncbi:nucleoside diphosphate kinase 2, chloroplastic [Tanacetum coccineum]
MFCSKAFIQKVCDDYDTDIGRISFFTSKGIIINALELLALSHDDVPRLLRDIGLGGIGGCSHQAQKLIGETSPFQAEPGTIREDLAVQIGRNVVHGSDNPKERAICNYSQILIVNNQHLG